MKKKTYTHHCRSGDPLNGKKASTGKKVSPMHRSVRAKSLQSVYNRYYRDQVTALYQAIQD